MNKYLTIFALLFMGCQHDTASTVSASEHAVAGTSISIDTDAIDSVDELVHSGFAATCSETCQEACAACAGKPGNAGPCSVCHSTACKPCR